jgi:PAS domain S-box-containing protein
MDGQDTGLPAEVAAALRENVEHFRQLAHALPGMLWLAGIDGGRTFVNQRWLEFTGRGAETELGLDWLAGLHPQEREATTSAFRVAVSARVPFEIEYRLRRANGSYRWFLDRGTPLFRGVEFTGYIGTCMDITERRNAVDFLRLLARVSADTHSLDSTAALTSFTRCVTQDFAERCEVYLEDAVDSGIPSAVGVRDGLDDAAIVGLPVSVIRGVIGSGRSQLLEQDGWRICVPLAGRRGTVGAVTFSNSSNERRQAHEALLMSQELARRVAVSLDNGELFRQTQTRESALTRMNHSLQFLADASMELSRSLDPQETLARVAELAVPRFADICIVDVVKSPEALERVAIAISDERLAEPLSRMRRTGGATPIREDEITARIAAGRSMFFPSVSRETLMRFMSGNPSLAAALGDAGLSSGMIVPLMARDRVLGVLTCLMARPGQQYTEDDLSVAEQLGHRAGLSLENARLYRRAQEREAELSRANEAKDEFLGLMSHELRTPITVVHGGARVLRARWRELDDDTRASMFTDVERESDRLARMLENLLALARVELGQETPVEPVLLQRLLQRLIAHYEAGAGHRPLEFVADPSTGTAAAAPGYVEHVVRNLISNAEKYSPAGSVIEVHLRAAAGRVDVLVMDRGFGVPEDEAERIFERFYRSERTSGLAGGAGMGLAVCKRLIEAMSGEIWARSREGGGLEVGFSLPLYEEHEA